MTTYDNTNRGGLWRNKDQKTDKHPNMKGTLNVNGVEFDLAAWSKVSKAGDKYLSLTVQKKREIEQKLPENGKAIPSMPADFDDRDLPF